MRKNNSPAVRTDGNDFAASLFVSIIAVFLALAYFAARFGFENNSVFRIIQVVGLSFFLIYLPEITNFIRLKLGREEFWYSSKPFILILGLFFLVLLGMLSPVLNTLLAVAALGFIFFAVSFYLYLKNIPRKVSILAVFIFALALSGWVIGALWGRNLLNPLYLERVVLGDAPIDAVFHSSVVSIIKTFWIPSTGLDGVPYLQYHWGSHYIFAQIAKLLNLNSVDFYNLAYPVILAPFVVRSFIYLVDAFRKCFKIQGSYNWKFYLLLVFVFTGIIPTRLIDKMGIMVIDIFVSESYSLTLAVAFLLLSLVLYLKERLVLEKISRDVVVFNAVFLPLMLGLIGLLKISIFILLAVVFVYFVVRLGLYRKSYFFISAILSLIVTAIIFKYSYLGEGAKYSLFHYVERLVDGDFRIFFPLTYFFWVWIYFAIRLKLLGAKTFSDIGALLKSKRILDLEFLLVIALVGVVPGMIFDVEGASAFFFSDFQRWLALSFILALMPLWWPRKLFEKNAGISGLKLFSACFVLVVIFASYYSYRNIENIFMYKFIRKNIKIRYQLMFDESESKKRGHLGYIKHLIIQKHVPINKAIATAASQAQKDLEKNKKYQLIKFLETLSDLSDKNNMMLYVPQDNFLYWNLADYRNIQLLIPSITGMPMLGGVQPFVSAELDAKEMKILTKHFDDKQMQTFGIFYAKVEDEQADPLGKKQTFKYILKKDLSYDEKITIYDLVAPEYYHRLRYYGYWLYSFPFEAEYLEKFSSDEKICQQAAQKGFSKVIIITADQDSNFQSRELNCR